MPSQNERTESFTTPSPNPQASPTPSKVPISRSSIIPNLTATPTFLQSVDPEGTPFVPIVGGADRIAFIEKADIWMANLDGSNLTQLTHDGLPKTNPRWSPDGGGVIYLSGTCVNFVDTNTFDVEMIACFGEAQRLEAFELSPDATQIAISLDRQLYIIPYDLQQLSKAKSSEDLAAMGNCAPLSPYKHRQSLVTVKSARWSADGNRLAIIRQGLESDRLVDLIHILDLTTCQVPPPRLDEFPATRFEMQDYATNPVIQNFAWDGYNLIALTSFQRNDGFGDLWIYNTGLHRGFLANPIDGKCCYRDPTFSPDGKYLAFVFQDSRTSPYGPASLYIVPYEAIDTSMVFPPLQLPDNFFTQPRLKPQPIFRTLP
jgi:hypothetical protein